MAHMAESGAAEGRFKARAGTLTLAFLTSSYDTSMLLEILERARYGGLMGPPDDDSLEENREPLEPEAPEAGPDLESLEPEPLMRATDKGRQGLYVGFTLERWLRNCPTGPLRISTGGDATASLICGWSATVTHALAGPPRRMEELDRAVEVLSLETLEEHLEAMIRTGLAVALIEGDGDGETRYAATDWLREGIAPLAAAARFERRHSEPGTTPPDTLDVEAAFQLTLPLLRLPDDLDGRCRLGVQIPGGPPLLVGATVAVAQGRVVSISTELDADAENFATGSPIDWMDTLVDPTAARIKIGGDRGLASALVEGLHDRLFGVTAR
jgi:DNA-binding HxlR family transcriptional regulator